MAERPRLSGIYGILPADIETEELLSKAEAALRGGVGILQLRDKQQGYKRRIRRATALRELTRRYGALLFINDDLRMALDCHADGVHLGRTDLQDLATLRQEAGERLTIGISCKGDALFAQQALAHGADYVSFGAIYPTSSKQDATPIGLARLQKARTLFPEANICAIGGIGEAELPAVKLAGADCAAVISALFGVDDIEAAARRMEALWQATPQSA